MPIGTAVFLTLAGMADGRPFAMFEILKWPVLAGAITTFFGGVPAIATGITAGIVRRRFQSLPVAYGEKPIPETERPIYLRRGAYFQAICRVLDGDFDALTNTVFCGDIWEMDLAMPYALGAKVHLLDRAAPFETYSYERRALAGYEARGKTSANLSGLLGWL